MLLHGSPAGLSIWTITEEIDMEEITVTIRVNRDDLNWALGNTPNVTLQAAMDEFLTAAFSKENEYCHYCDCDKPEPIKAEWSFKD